MGLMSTNAAPAAKKGSNKKVKAAKVFTFKNLDKAKDAKIPKQMFAILSGGLTDGKPYSEKDIADYVNGLHKSGKLETTQKPMSIFAYYRSKMQDKGFLDLSHKTE